MNINNILAENKLFSIKSKTFLSKKALSKSIYFLIMFSTFALLIIYIAFTTVLSKTISVQGNLTFFNGYEEFKTKNLIYVNKYLVPTNTKVKKGQPIVYVEELIVPAKSKSNGFSSKNAVILKAQSDGIVAYNEIETNFVKKPHDPIFRVYKLPLLLSAVSDLKTDALNLISKDFITRSKVFLTDDLGKTIFTEATLHLNHSPAYMTNILNNELHLQLKFDHEIENQLLTNPYLTEKLFMKTQFSIKQERLLTKLFNKIKGLIL